MPESSIDLYVSPAGDDAWSGRHPDPTGDGGEGPFATLEAARDALRERRRSGATGGATVWLRGWSHQRESESLRRSVARSQPHFAPARWPPLHTRTDRTASANFVARHTAVLAASGLGRSVECSSPRTRAASRR